MMFSDIFYSSQYSVAEIFQHVIAMQKLCMKFYLFFGYLVFVIWCVHLATFQLVTCAGGTALAHIALNP